MQEKSEKIKNGTLRIENDRLVGLGLGGRESINLNALDKVMGEISPREMAERLDEIVMKIGGMGLELNWDGAEEATLENVRAFLPNGDDLSILHRISKLFKA